MSKSSFFIIGKHAVLEALKNPKRKVLRLFLTEESKKTIHRSSPRKNLLKGHKIYFKTKKELDRYSIKENIQHQGFVAEIEHLEKIDLKSFIKNKINNFTTAHPDMMPMGNDIIKIEYFLTPGSIILTDGRSANAKFLRDTFKRNWLYIHQRI